MNAVDRQRLMVREALALCDRLDCKWRGEWDAGRRNRIARTHRKAVDRWERRFKAYEAIPYWQQARVWQEAS